MPSRAVASQKKRIHVTYCHIVIEAQKTGLKAGDLQLIPCRLLVLISFFLFLRNGKKKVMRTKDLKLIQLAETLVIISGLSAILFTGIVLIAREFSVLSNLLNN